MERRRVSMRDGPLSELFRPTTTAPAGGSVAAPSFRKRAWRWRPTAFALLGIATLQLALFAAVAATLLTRPAERASPAAPSPLVTKTVFVRPPPPPPARAARTRVSPLRPRARTRVLVLNGNGIRGAAARAAEVVRAHSYPVIGTADASRWDYRQSIVVYKHGLRREAERLRGDLSIDAALQPLAALSVPDAARAELVLVVARRTS